MDSDANISFKDRYERYLESIDDRVFDTGSIDGFIDYDNTFFADYDDNIFIDYNE